MSRIERAESSPTTALLNKLCVAYGLTMSRLLSEVENEAALLLKAEQQLVWQDKIYNLASGDHQLLVVWQRSAIVATVMVGYSVMPKQPPSC